MIDFIFNLVAVALFKVAKMTHLTYNEINIIVYYLIIPMLFYSFINPVQLSIVRDYFTGLKKY